jgi:hypothetical protein
MVSLKATLLMATMVLTAVIATPLHSEVARQITCANVRCCCGYICEMHGNKPKCVPRTTGDGCGPTVCGLDSYCCDPVKGVCAIPGGGCPA